MCGGDGVLGDLVEEDEWHLINSVVMSVYAVATAMDKVVMMLKYYSVSDITDIATNIAPLCSVYKAQLNKLSHT